MYSNGVWDLEEASEGIKPIGCKWVYKRKRMVDGKVEKYKARLVAKAHLDYEIWKMNIKTMFLNGDLEENIYMMQPNRFIEKGQEHLVTYIDKLLVKYVIQDSKKGLLLFKHGMLLSQDQCPKTTEEKDHMKG
ncbi:Retrovirus-related Pol polyprotein from transposon TNT 1-94 [Vitis vinifera]|uniref:Retrovirus-related Pol polyprotein from transposon TNT 1-94 n=1 Tax=Vitis vinifera TaxID=29760 RepID=A0A438D1Z1_VITVI|nr:Retrovirus-related Pol polyprotein from transposon TNT 1-94 [Vitis vinifera]